MNKKILFSAGAVIVLGVLLFFSLRSTDMNYGSAGAPASGSSTEIGATQLAASSTYTAAEVAVHTDSASCWAIINGGVYDLTAWIPNHPGGPDKILAICGKDGSAAFNQKHGENERALRTLESFKIGTAGQ